MDSEIRASSCTIVELVSDGGEVVFPSNRIKSDTSVLLFQSDLAGWQLDKLAEKASKQVPGANDDSDSDSDDEDIPWACYICRKEYTDPGKSHIFACSKIIFRTNPLFLSFLLSSGHSLRSLLLFRLRHQAVRQDAEMRCVRSTDWWDIQSR